jgi:hypothetical protein
MLRINRLGMALVVSLALSALAAAPAALAVEPSILPEPTEASPLEGGGRSGMTTIIVGAYTFTCRRDRVTMRAVNAFTSTRHVLKEDCTVPVDGFTLTCTGEGDRVVGTTLVLTTISSVFALRMKNATETELVVALVSSPNETQFTCESESGLIKASVSVRGCSAGLATPIEKFTSKTDEIHKEFESGKPEILEYLPRGAKEEKPCATEVSVNEGKFESGAEAGEEEYTEFMKGGKAIEIEIMS